MLRDHHSGQDCANFTEDDRKSVFKIFWNLKDFDLQNTFITGSVEELLVEHNQAVGRSRPKQKEQPERKKWTRLYRLRSQDNQTHRVCKKIYLETVGVSNWRVDRVLKHQRQNVGMPFTDQRGKQTQQQNQPS